MAGGGIAVFVLASALWSVDAAATLVPGAIFSFLIVAAYVFAVYLDPADFVRTTFWTMAFIILASFVLLAVAPEFVTKPRGDGGWLSNDQFLGILATKNGAGMLFASAVMISVLAGSLRISLVWRIGVAILGLAGVVLSNAATTAVVLVLVTSLAMWMKYVRVLRFEIAFCVAIILLALVLALPFIDFSELHLFEFLGRDSSLTGRDQLWVLALEYIEKRPILGYGYHGFFSADPYSPAWFFWDNFRYFITGSFHNSAADVAIALGLTGVVVLCGVCLGSFFVVFNRTIDDASRCILILFVHVSLVDSMTNFAIFFHNSFPTFIVFYAFFAAGQRYAGNSVDGIGVPAS
ncbi:MAG: O-antigen ligase family protein [Methyloligellaceae bacterium]